MISFGSEAFPIPRRCAALMKIHSFSRSSLSVVSDTRGRVLSALPFLKFFDI